MASYGSSGHILLSGPDDAGIALVTISRPETLNSITLQMLKDLASVFRYLGEEESGCRVAILCGEGGNFTSGVDLSAARSVFQGEIGGVDESPFVQIAECKVPVIGAINGVAFTAGLELALACDILVGGPSAKFADTHCKYGLMPTGGASQKLPRVIGPNRARFLSFSSSTLPAKTAFDWGLLSHLTQHDEETLPLAFEIAQKIARNNRQVVRGYKSVLNDGLKIALGDGLELERRTGYAQYQTIDARAFETMKGFKRKGKESHIRPKL